MVRLSLRAKSIDPVTHHHGHATDFLNFLRHDATHRQSPVVLSSKARTNYFAAAVHIPRLE